MKRTLSLMAAAAAALFLLVGTAGADIYVTSPGTGRVAVLDAAGQVIRTLGDTGGLEQPYSVVLDSQRNLIVADWSAGRIVRLDPDGTNGTVIASNIPKPDGLSLGPAGEIFLVSRDDRTLAGRFGGRAQDESSLYLRGVWMIPPDGGMPVMIASIDDSIRLAQSVAMTSGELLVLSTRPGFVARLRPVATGGFERLGNLITAIPGEPTSMTLSSLGTILISTSDGRVLGYSKTGVRLPDFAIGQPVGASRISSGIDGVVNLTTLGGTELRRFDRNGHVLSPISISGVPMAGTVQGSCVPTPTGTQVTVTPSAGVNVIFDRVVSAGETCLRSTPLAAGQTLSPNGNTIPPFARKLFEDPGFVVQDVTTTAGFTDSIAVEFLAPNPNARLLVAHGSGQTFEDATVLVTPIDPRGRVGGLSEFVIYLDTRPTTELVLTKVADLQANVANGVNRGVDPDLVALFQGIVDGITAAVGSAGKDADREQASNLIRQFKALARSRSGNGLPNGIDAVPGSGATNPAGDWLAAADTLLWSLRQ